MRKIPGKMIRNMQRDDTGRAYYLTLPLCKNSGIALTVIACPPIENGKKRVYSMKKTKLYTIPSSNNGARSDNVTLKFETDLFYSF
jgi:hypothetical protein